MVWQSLKQFDRNSSLQLAVALLLLATAMLMGFFFIYHANTLHVMPSFINDQVHHIGLARHLVDYGTVLKPELFPGTGNIIYLGLLKTANVRIYMPGFYTLLAGSFWLFGVSTLSAILPSMLAFLVSTLLVFYIANKLYGKSAACYATLLFIFTPMMMFYAYLAMTEMPLICVSLTVFAIMITLPKRYQAWAIPVLIVVPYLFRQTAMLLLFPMIAQAYDMGSIKKRWQMVLLFLFSFAVLQVVDLWQVHLGLLKLPIMDFLKYGHISYNTVDAAPKAVPFSKLIEMIYYHVINNISVLVHTLRFGKFLPKLTKVMFYLGFVMSFLVTFYGFKKRRAALFPMATALLVVALFSILMMLYSANYNKITRHLMYCIPFLIIVISGMMVDQSVSSNSTIGYLQKSKNYVLLLVMTLSFIGNIHAAKHMRRDEKFTAERTQFIESVHADEKGVLIAPCYMTPQFIYKHYPMLVSFTPKNDESLILLSQYRNLGTLILNEYDLQYRLSQKAIAKVGLTLTEIRHYHGAKWYVYRHHIGSKESHKS